MAVRIDSSVRLDGVKRTPQGGLRVDAAVARTGILTYRRSDGSEVREYLSPEEAFKADSLATLAAAPVTRLHPPVMVDRKNWKQYAAGTVGETPRQDGNKIAAQLYLQDDDLASAVERGDMREVSCGYTCDLVNTPGTTPEGERYDRLQVNRQYNHVAIVPVGRAGSEVAVRLDADDNAITAVTYQHREGNMKVERIDGLEYEVGSELHRAAVERRDAQARKDKADLDALRAERDKLKTDSAALQAQHDLVASELVKLKKDEADRARTALETSARRVLGKEAKFDGQTDAQIKRAVATAGVPEMPIVGKADAYVDVVFDMAINRADKAAESLGALNAAIITAPHVDAADKPIDVEQLRADMQQRDANRWTGKKKA